MRDQMRITLANGRQEGRCEIVTHPHMVITSAPFDKLGGENGRVRKNELTIH